MLKKNSKNLLKEEAGCLRTKLYVNRVKQHKAAQEMTSDVSPRVHTELGECLSSSQSEKVLPRSSP